MSKVFGMKGWMLSLALACAATTAQAADVKVAAVQSASVQVACKGYSLQAEQQGQGPVTVVFESGFGQGAGVWKDTIANLGADCTCIAYARAAGWGKSTCPHCAT